MKLIKFVCYLLINLIRIFNLTELYQPTYNPRKKWFFKKKLIKRDSENRIKSIIEKINFNSINSYLDIGSQLGYFTLRLGELNRNMFVVGLEMNQVSYIYSVALALLNNTGNVAFGRVKISHENIKGLPKFDVISFLNVFHHIVYFEGFEVANKIMVELYNKCNKYFIFETGQYNEKGFYWTEKLRFMGSNPDEWTKNYLLKIGYSNVEIIGKFDTHLGTKRSLFLCKR